MSKKYFRRGKKKTKNSRRENKDSGKEKIFQKSLNNSNLKHVTQRGILIIKHCKTHKICIKLFGRLILLKNHKLLIKCLLLNLPNPS